MESKQSMFNKNIIFIKNDELAHCVTSFTFWKEVIYCCNYSKLIGNIVKTYQILNKDLCLIYIQYHQVFSTSLLHIFKGNKLLQNYFKFVGINAKTYEIFSKWLLFNFHKLLASFTSNKVLLNCIIYSP